MKLNNVLNTVENTSIVLGVSISLATIETVMGIIILAFQIGLIVTKCVIKIIDKIKHKDVQGAISDIEETQRELDERMKK